MSKLESMRQRFRCPACLASEFDPDMSSDSLDCRSCGSSYPLSAGRPVLLRGDNELFCQDDYVRSRPPGSNAATSRWKKLVPEPSMNLAREPALDRVRVLLSHEDSASVLVVGGGSQRSSLDAQLGSTPGVEIFYSDIDIRADVDLFCDGHDLPFRDGSFDAVITTAVLEHVLYPERVAEEIMRVLRPGGLLYSELPFMQQVHEGAYDFTRYTMSGHRRLFNHVAELESGLVAGPATVLVWSIENFVLAFVSRSQIRSIAKAGVRLLFGWLKYFDLLVRNNPAAMDGASCTYLLGRKGAEPVADKSIIDDYSGAQRLRHT